MNRKFLRIASYILVIIMLLFGICIYSYPLISGYISDRNFEIAIDNFENIKSSVYDDEQNVADNDSADGESAENNNSGVDYTALYNEMKKYNSKIYTEGQKGLCDAWSYEQSSIDLSEYGVYNGAVGVLRVPAMSDLEMPIYLGASRNNMSMGAAQLGQTSMPIGGVNTNCVLAGHRGWNGARYFLDIEQMQIGDRVYIDNFWTTLTYEVCDIKVIQPDDIDSILIQEGRDMVTLITCHPYWASTYRYAVFCSRVYVTDENLSDADKDGNLSDEQSASDADYVLSEEDGSIKFDSSRRRIFAERFSYVAVAVFIVALAALLFIRRQRKRNYIDKQ